MKTYRFVCKISSGGVARFERNFHNDRAAREDAERMMKENKDFSTVTVLNERRKVCEMVWLVIGFRRLIANETAN